MKDIFKNKIVIAILILIAIGAIWYFFISKENRILKFGGNNEMIPICKIEKNGRLIRMEELKLPKLNCKSHHVTVVDEHGDQHFYVWYTKNGFIVSRSDCTEIK